MMYETAGMVFRSGVGGLNLTAGDRLFHYIGVSSGSSPLSELHLFIFP